MIKVCYFSLDQWEIRIHLIRGKCFNITHHWPLIVNYQDFPIFSSNFKILEILKFFHQFIKENHQFIKFIKFHKIFFWTSSLHPKNYKCKHKYGRRQKRWLAYFSSRDDYKSYTWLTIGWHLADNCTSATTWHFDILPMPEVFHAVWVSPGAVTKYFLMFTAIIGQSKSILIC